MHSRNPTHGLRRLHDRVRGCGGTRREGKHDNGKEDDDNDEDWAEGKGKEETRKEGGG